MDYIFNEAAAERTVFTFRLSSLRGLPEAPLEEARPFLGRLTFISPRESRGQTGALAKSLTQTALGDEVGVWNTAIGAWEHGRRLPTKEAYAKLVAALPAMEGSLNAKLLMRSRKGRRAAKSSTTAEKRTARPAETPTRVNGREILSLAMHVADARAVAGRAAIVRLLRTVAPLGVRPADIADMLDEQPEREPMNGVEKG